jgi:tetratricopeptide (TPR) repeat protein
MGYTQKQMDLLKAILDKNSEPHTQNAPFQALAQFSLAYVYMEDNKKEAALDIFAKLIGEKAADNCVRNSSLLYFCRLLWKQMPLNLRKADNPELIILLKHLKNLQVRRNLAHEPIHLEAALDYIQMSLDLEPPEKKAGQALLLFKQAKEEIIGQEDIVSKDYQATRLLLPEKDTVYQAYLMFIDARIAQLESEMAEKKHNMLEMESKQEIARMIYRTLIQGEFAVSKYLTFLAKSHLPEVTKIK